MSDDLVAFLTARLDEDERELEKDPPVGLGYANLPARMRREVAAKRAILAQWEAMPPGSPMLVFVLYNLAAVYGDHPDYRPEWKP